MSKQTNVLEDLAELTQVPVSILVSISEILIKEIGHLAYEEFILSGREEAVIDLGIGCLTLYSGTADGENFISYDFTPSKQLERTLVDTLTEEESPLIDSIEKKLQSKILALYKELL